MLDTVETTPIPKVMR
jgi:hypothetical protein